MHDRENADERHKRIRRTIRWHASRAAATASKIEKGAQRGDIGNLSALANLLFLYGQRCNELAAGEVLAMEEDRVEAEAVLQAIKK